MSKFQIGDHVIHLSVLAECEERWKCATFLNDLSGLVHIPKIYIITHVFVEYCHGGCTQTIYNVEHADQGQKRWIEGCVVPAERSTDLFMKYAGLMKGLKDKEKEEKAAMEKFLEERLFKKGAKTPKAEEPVDPITPPSPDS